MSAEVELKRYAQHKEQSFDKAIIDDDYRREEENVVISNPNSEARHPGQDGSGRGDYKDRNDKDDDSLTDTESELDLNEDIASIASSVADRLTWRGRTQVALHSTGFHIFVISLVLLDSLIVLFELLLDVGALSNELCIRTPNLLIQSEFCHFSQGFSHMCAAPFSRFLCNQPEDIEHFTLAFTRCANRHINQTHNVCKCGYRGGRRECIPFGSDTGVDPAFVLHCLSIGILAIFILEFLLKLIAFRLKFFTHKFEVFDAVVVFLSFTFDIASGVDEEAFQVASLLILLRLWRIVRVVNGIVLTTTARRDTALHQARGEARKIVHILHKTQKRLVEEMEEKDRMTKLLEEHSIEYTPMEKKTPLKPLKKEPLDEELPVESSKQVH